MQQAAVYNHRSDLGDLADPKASRFLEPTTLDGFSGAELLGMLESMLEIRFVEEQIGDWVTAGTVRCPCHLGIGQEAVAVGVAAALRSSDRLFGNHRSHAHFLAVKCPPFELLAEVLGRDSGCSRGMGGSMHLRGADRGFIGSVPIVAGTIPVAVGAGLAARLDAKGDIAVAYFGDGACEEGVLHESLNLARVLPAPVLFVCENNQFSSHLDIALRQPSDRVSRYAEAHRVRHALVDGNDAPEVARIARALVEQMRQDGLPAFLEAVTYRWRGHVGPNEDADVGVRRSVEDLRAWKARDPVARMERALVAKNVATAAQVAAIHSTVRKRIEEDSRRALDAPFPPAQALLDFVYARSGEQA